MLGARQNTPAQKATRSGLAQAARPAHGANSQSSFRIGYAHRARLFGARLNSNRRTGEFTSFAVWPRVRAGPHQDPRVSAQRPGARSRTLRKKATSRALEDLSVRTTLLLRNLFQVSAQRLPHEHH